LKWLVLVGLLCLGRAAGAQVSCPWLTVGTAEKVLGGLAKTEVKMLAPPRVDEGRCLFTADAGALEIVVSGEQQKECGPESEKVRGTGNEAWFCGLGKRVTVEGRVRAMYFRTTLSGVDDGRKKVEMIAELVAGNLF
jgi:hypothetical protein